MTLNLQDRWLCHIVIIARLRGISWSKAAKSKDYHLCSNRVNVADIWRERAYTLFALIIYKVIPQENTKKKLDIIEYKVYRKRGKCILVIELAISIVMHIIDYSIVYTHIMYSFGLIVILLCMSDGYLKRCVKDW